jgi:uncharacterized protein (DUF58 family)
MKKLPLRLLHFDRPGVNASIHLRQVFPFIFFSLLLTWYLLYPSPGSAAGMAGLGCLLALAYGWARQMARHVSARRTLRYAAFQVGDELEEMLHLENQSFLPVLWAEYCDHSTLPGHSASLIRAAGSHSTLSWRVNTLCTRRGLYTLGPWELRIAGDPFGIFEVIQQYGSSQEVLIYPPLARLPPGLLVHRISPGERSPLNQPLPADTARALTTTPRQPQDPLRRIHWPTTAHRGELYVRVMEPEAASRLWLVADFDAAVQVSNGNDSTVETQVTLLASLSLAFVRSGLPVGLFTSGKPACLVPPHPGIAHHWAMLRALALLQPAAGQTFASTLVNLRPLLRAGDLVVAVTPSLDSSWVKPLAALLRSHTTAQPAARVILLDPASFDERMDPNRSSSLLQALSAARITVQQVRCGDIRPQLSAYGRLRRWEFKILASGRVITLQSPRPAAAPPEPAP